MARSRAERFDALVLEALEPIEARWRTELTDLDVAVDDVPDLRTDKDNELVWEDGLLADRDVPLARLVPAGVDRWGQPTRARAADSRAARAPAITSSSARDPCSRSPGWR